MTDRLKRIRTETSAVNRVFTDARALSQGNPAAVASNLQLVIQACERPEIRAIGTLASSEVTHG